MGYHFVLNPVSPLLIFAMAYKRKRASYSKRKLTGPRFSSVTTYGGSNSSRGVAVADVDGDGDFDDLDLDLIMDDVKLELDNDDYVDNVPYIVSRDNVRHDVDVHMLDEYARRVGKRARVTSLLDEFEDVALSDQERLDGALSAVTHTLRSGEISPDVVESAVGVLEDIDHLSMSTRVTESVVRALAVAIVASHPLRAIANIATAIAAQVARDVMGPMEDGYWQDRLRVHQHLD